MLSFSFKISYLLLSLSQEFSFEFLDFLIMTLQNRICWSHKTVKFLFDLMHSAGDGLHFFAYIAC